MEVNGLPYRLIRVLVCWGIVWGCASPIAASTPPNVVFFLIDDLGWTDLGFMYEHLGRSQQYYETPNIDALAAQSMFFTDAYSNGPNCAPSRASLMSGRYTPVHGIYTVGDPRRGNHIFRRLEPISNRTVLAPEFVTLAETLRANGYATASMGKWHLGKDPTTQGFDVNVAGREWGSPSGGGYHSPLRYPHLEVLDEGTYLTDALTDRAVRFIEEHHDQPFFLYLAHYAVHTPIQSKDALRKKYQEKTPTDQHKNPKYAGMIQSMDESVGRVMDTLADLQLGEQTIVVFFSDNGGHGGATSNAPLRGAKGMLYEGGIRVPLLIRWPGTTQPGSQCQEVVMGTDLYPTLVEMTASSRSEVPPLDGMSLVPLLRDPTVKLPRDAVFWHFPAYLQGKGDPLGGPFRTTPAGAVRSGKWKLIEWFETGRLELYDLAADLGEKDNLITQHAAEGQRLHAKLRRWRETIAAPIPTKPNPRFRPLLKDPRAARQRVSP